MSAPPTLRQSVPPFLLAALAGLVLLVLFVVGWREQLRLAQEHAEQVIRQRQEIASIVADAIDSDLQQTARSANRFATDLERYLDRHAGRADNQIDQRFAQQFARQSDGAIRSRPELFDGSRHAGLALPTFLQPDAGQRELFVLSQAFIESFGRGAEGQHFVDSWLLAAPGGEVIFWPDQPRFIYDAPADFDYRDTEWVTLTRPDRNPNRRVYWTKLAFDPVPQVWMLSAVAPLYWRGQWSGSVGHDVPLAALLARTELLRQQAGSQFILVTEEGVVAASDVYADAIKASQGTLTLPQLPDPIWQRVLSMASNAASEASAENAALRHQRIDIAQHVAFVSRIPEQRWLLVNLIPLAPVQAPIESSFTKLRLITMATLVLVLLIAAVLLAWTRRRGQQHISKLHGMQQQLAISEAHYRNLVANIPGMVYRCANDADWTMEFVSSAATELTGYPASDFLGNGVRSYASIIHPDDQQLVFERVQQGIAKEQAFSIEYRIQHRDGSWHCVLEHGRPVIHDNQLTALEGIILDVTPLKQAEAQLRELNSSLEQQVDARTAELRSAIKELESFNYAVSHDLRAPVRHVDGYLSLLQEALAAQPDAQCLDLITRSQRALKRMNEMISGLLSLAQLGRESLRRQAVDLQTMVQEIIHELPEASRQRLQLDIGPLPTVNADRVLLRQVLQNLIDNALKYSQRNPQSLLAIHETSADADVENGAAEWVFEVADNGVGFDSQQATELFTLFHRLHPASEFPGTGVGLALCAKIIALHGGRIWAESAPGQGARFFFSLPRQLP
ncbi:PAS domain-containing protein [Permianibacter sp. IMCC34836]|uniref:ATP-binding protein n=1 Tax=Permianibacter fluminis TaxID=2738515 RepID=UPI001552FAA3|nr:ATP-binding protein [Permianibacter fluminis]NQD35677.1 PAS domain-containing protein [Permianibacter fluminis]